eukprot:5534112-Amphidinium_carterae.1
MLVPRSSLRSSLLSRSLQNRGLLQSWRPRSVVRNIPDLDGEYPLPLDLPILRAHGTRRREVVADIAVEGLDASVPSIREATTLVLSDGVGQLRCTDDDGKTTCHLMTFTHFQGMQWVSKQQFECLQQALWTVQLGTVTDCNTSFWKDVAKKGFAKYLTGIDEYKNNSARSVRFVHNTDPVGDTSDSHGEGLKPPTPHSQR